jgi:hypothetical protein
MNSQSLGSANIYGDTLVKRIYKMVSYNHEL